jgi:isopenicillin N synthase-like dioxygenase
MDSDALDLEAPEGPPPLLSAPQLKTLCSRGYLNLSLPDHLVQSCDDLFAAAGEFFSETVDTKSELFPARPGDTEHGFSHLADEKEYLTVRYRTVSDGEEREKAQGLEAAMSRVWESSAHLLYRILVDLSHHLGYVSPAAWDDLVRYALSIPETRATAGPTLLRVFRYEPRHGTAEPHRDLGLLTLCVCRGRGLQVREMRGPSTTPAQEGIRPDQPEIRAVAPAFEWRDAGQVALFVGDALRVLSGNRVRAGSHRVIATDEGRSSIVFALRPPAQGTIDLAKFGGHGEIDIAAFWNRIRTGRVNVNAQKEVRDEQRAKLQSRHGVA